MDNRKTILDNLDQIRGLLISTHSAGCQILDIETKYNWQFQHSLKIYNRLNI